MSVSLFVPKDLANRWNDIVTMKILICPRKVLKRGTYPLPPYPSTHEADLGKVALDKIASDKIASGHLL